MLKMKKKKKWATGYNAVVQKSVKMQFFSFTY